MAGDGKRKRQKTKSSVKDVVKSSDLRKEIKRIVGGMAETKSYLGAISMVPLEDTVRCTNLLYNISQGTAKDDVVGLKYHIKNIRFHGYIYNTASANINYNGAGRIIVFRDKNKLTSSSTTLSASDLLRVSGTNAYYAMTGHVDLAKVDLLYDELFELTQPTSTARISVPVRINIPINKTVNMDTDASGWVKDKNIYMAFLYYTGEGDIASASFGLIGDYAVNFTDL